MLLLIRRLRQRLLSNSEFRKYLLYVLGEMMLVIVGILIALQIDNWNSARKDRETLESYLQSIARNISADMDAAEQVRERREDAFQSSMRKWALIEVGLHAYSKVETVTLSYSALMEARGLHHLQTNDSAYEALKSTGNLDQLQGTDLEALLYDYSDTVGRIQNAERSHNDYSRELWLRILANWPEGLQEWEVSDPSVLTSQRFEELRPAYNRLLGGTHANALGVHAISVSPLLLEYARLHRLGTAFVYMVDNGLMDYDAEARRILDGIHDPARGAGYPAVIEEGRVSWHSYFILASDSNLASVSDTALEDGGQNSGPSGLEPSSIDWLNDSMVIDYPGGAEWAGVWITVGQAGSVRTGADFSGFDTLLLELRSDAGDETVFVELQDRDDAPDGSQTRVPIQVNDQWQTYEVDLAEFETADLTKLRVVAGFVFGEEPTSFSIRTIRYLDKH